MHLNETKLHEEKKRNKKIKQKCFLYLHVSSDDNLPSVIKF